MSNVYDVEDLKAQIRQMRSTRLALQQESEALEKEINSLQGKADTIKQQLSIESVNDELRMIGSDVMNDPVNDDSSVAEDSVDVRRFKLLNDKLDKQILNQDMRQHLPQLEALAATWEKNLRDSQKIARRNEKEQAFFPQYYISPAVKIKEQTENSLQQLSAVRAQATREAEVQRSRKVPLCQEINLLRRQINALYEEKESLIPVVIRSESAYSKELSRIKILKKEHVRVRELLSSYHSKFVWQTEAFLKHMKSLDSLMPISLIPTAVVPWICFSEAESPEALLTDEYLRDKIRRLSSTSTSTSRNRHRHDSEDEKAQEGKSEENGEEIGFRTFCRLCEGIIEDFETVSG